MREERPRSVVEVEPSSNLSAARRFLGSALADAHPDDAVSLLAPDVRHHVHGHNLFTGDFRGADAVLSHLQSMYRVTGGHEPIVKYEDWLTSDERVLAIIRHQFQLHGRVASGRGLVLFEFDPDHVIREIHIFTEDEAAFDAEVGTYEDD